MSQRISNFDFVMLNGRKQWLLSTGYNFRKPVVLFLHGGPGMPSTGMAQQYFSVLEQHFVVVHWEQRCAGKSFGIQDLWTSLSVDDFVADASALLVYLCEKYHQEKIIVVGYSWGTVIGMRLAARYPARMACFFSICQFTTTLQMEELSYQFVVQRANETGNRKAISELAKIKGPPYAGLGAIMKQRKWLNYFGGGVLGADGNRELFALLIKDVKEYSLIDKAKAVMGTLVAFSRLIDEINKLDLINEIEAIGIPVYFFAGKNDFITPMSLIQQFHDKLSCPEKELLVFESAHDIPFTQSNSFQQLLLERANAQRLGEIRETA